MKNTYKFTIYFTTDVELDEKAKVNCIFTDHGLSLVFPHEDGKVIKFEPNKFAIIHKCEKPKLEEGMRIILSNGERFTILNINEDGSVTLREHYPKIPNQDQRIYHNIVLKSYEIL